MLRLADSLDGILIKTHTEHALINYFENIWLNQLHYWVRKKE